MITQDELKELLRYDPKTGVFIWIGRTHTNSPCKIGKRAGGLDSDGYVAIRIKGQLYRAHRLAFLYMTGSFPEIHVDHINHAKDDNRWFNLRQVDRFENQKNMSLSKRNTSGATGVHYFKRTGQWTASIYNNGKSNHVGYFKTFDEALSARKAKEKELGFNANHGKSN